MGHVKIAKRKIKEARLDIAAELYKRGYSMRKIQAEVIRRLELKSYSLQTVHRDVQYLLAEWRENRLKDIDEAIQLELERIDDIIRECWEQWDKSKEDYKKTASKRKGAPSKTEGQTSIKTIYREEVETDVVRLGDVSYLTEIRHQLAERRKLLGLYAPEEKSVKISEYDLSQLSEEQRDVLLSIGEEALNGENK